MTAPTTTDGAMMNTFDLQTCVRNALDPYAIGGRYGSDSAVDAVVSAVLLLSASKPAAPVILKGIGKRNGDGWKDTTKVGEVVFVWNAELPQPYKPGQYPRIGNQCGWTASTDQYNFLPATIEESRNAIEAMLAASPAAPAQSGEAVGIVGRGPNDVWVEWIGEPPAGGSKLYAAPQPSQPVEAREPFPYQKMFDAIAAATSVSAGHVEISVSKFVEAFGASPSAVVLDDERAAISEEDAKGLEVIAGWLDKDGLIEPAAMLRRLSSARAALPQTKANDEPTPLDDRAVVDLMLKATGEEYEESDAWKLRMFADYMAAAKPERGAGHD